MKSQENESPKFGCDLQRVQDFLSSDHYHLEDAELISHLDVCPSCREYLETQAGDPSRWEQASELLKTKEFDQASNDDFSAATQCGSDSIRPVAVKDVLDLLVPSEYPEHLGRLGAYEVTGVVGVGGMGVVLKAIDPSLDRVVAVKVMSPALAHNGNARKRFSREAKAAAAVLHPNVIPIHSVSSGSTLPYLVMSYIRGGSLQKRLDQEGALTLVEVLRIGSQIAAGLAAAHEQGLIHRDIKPENILLEEGVERVAITDFGLARAIDDNTITQMGSIAGTPQYMSPEQARGEALDQKSDLFSLGSLLYALCTGRPPFRDNTSYGVMRKIIDDSPEPLHKNNPAIPEWLAKIVSKLMAKDKADRFESAGEVQKLLEACLSHVQQPNGYQLPPIPSLIPQPTLSTKKRVPLMIKFAAGMITMAVLTALLLPFVQKPVVAPIAPSDETLVAMNDANYDISELTVSLAKGLTGRRESVTFPKVTSLEPEVAAVLSKHPGNLALPSISQLTAEVAKALVSESKSAWLVLDNLNEISPEVARELAVAKCSLRLGANKLTPDVAEILATRQGSLNLELKTISPDVAEKLAKHDAWLSFGGLRTIDAASAAQLAKHKGWLSLDELESLTPEVAEALGTFDGDKLDLNGLKSLDLEVAKRLANAKCRHGIYLNSVREVAPEVIEVLANGNSDLSFQGLEFIDGRTEQALADAKKKLQAMGQILMRSEAGKPFLKLDSHHQEGSANKGETLTLLWKLRGQSVKSIGVQAMHIKDGVSRVVSQGSFSVDGQKSIEAKLQLKSLDESLPTHGNVFDPSISVALDGVTVNADESEKFTMLGKFGIQSVTMSGSRERHDKLMWAISLPDDGFPNDIDRSVTDSEEAMISASRNGVEFLVVNLTWQPIDEVNGNGDKH